MEFVRESSIFKPERYEQVFPIELLFWAIELTVHV